MTETPNQAEKPVLAYCMGTPLELLLAIRDILNRCVFDQPDSLTYKEACQQIYKLIEPELTSAAPNQAEWGVSELTQHDKSCDQCRRFLADLAPTRCNIGADILAKEYYAAQHGNEGAK